MIIRKEHVLNLSTCNCLKGILACMILLCHLHGRVQLFRVGPLGGLLTSFGYLAVSVFFFLSGFGLTESAQLKSNYIKTFPNKKLLPFFLICAFTIFIYLIRDLLVGNGFSILLFIQSFLFGDTLVDNGWYLQTQLLFYLLFFIAFRLAKTKRTLILFVGAGLYCLFCVLFGLSSTWYEAGLCFPLGVFYSENKNKIQTFIFSNKLKFIFSFLSLVLLFAIFYVFGNKPYLPDSLRIVCKILSSLLFACVSTLFVLVVNINNPITRFLGKISLEIYLLQGIFLNLFKGPIYIESDFIYILLIILCTLLFAVLTHPVYKFISKLHFKE